MKQCLRKWFQQYFLQQTLLHEEEKSLSRFTNDNSLKGKLKKILLFEKIPSRPNLPYLYFQYQQKILP